MEINHNHPAATLYHLTEHDYGNQTHWAPKKFGRNRSPNEPQIPRICFSLSITGCFLSLGDIANHYHKWHLYSTVGEYYQPNDLEVVDAPAAQEVWRLSPTILTKKYSFSYQDRMRIKNHLYFSAGHPSAVKYQLHFKPKIEKILNQIFNDRNQT